MFLSSIIQHTHNSVQMTLNNTLLCCAISNKEELQSMLMWDHLRAVLRELLWTSQMSNHCWSTSLWGRRAFRGSVGFRLRSRPFTTRQYLSPFNRNTLLCVYEKYDTSTLPIGWSPGTTAGNTAVIFWGEDEAKRFVRTSNLNTWNKNDTSASSFTMHSIYEVIYISIIHLHLVV